MKVELKNYELSAAFRALRSFEDKDVDIVLGHNLGLMQLTLRDFVEKYEEKKNSTMQKHAKKDKDGEPIPVKDEAGNVVQGQIQIEDADAFMKNMNKLDTATVELTLPVKVTLADFKEANVKVKMRDIRDLSPLLSKD